MGSSLFDIPTKPRPIAKIPEAERLNYSEPTKTYTSSEPLPFEDNTSNLLNDWNQATNVPEDHFATEKAKEEPEEEEEEAEEAEIDHEEVGLDAESLDIISEAIIQSNDQGATWLINWLQGDEAEPFLGAPKNKLETLQKAWKGILLRIKYKPSGWDALLAAEWSAYGWHLMAALFSFIGRWFKGLVRMPWQAAKKVKKAIQTEPETKTVENTETVLDASDFVGKNSQPQKETSAQNSESEPMKICLETNKPFKGQGAPKTSTKHPELIGKFKDMGAFRAYCNRMGLSGPNSKKD